MKFFLATTSILLIAAAVIVMAKPPAEEIKALLTEFTKSTETCQEKVGATAADIEELMQKKMPSTMEGKCLHACLMKHYNMLDSNGKFSKKTFVETTVKIFHDDANIEQIAQEIGDKCDKETVPDNECEAATLYAKCLLEQAKLHNYDNVISA